MPHIRPFSFEILLSSSFQHRECAYESDALTFHLLSAFVCLCFALLVLRFPVMFAALWQFWKAAPKCETEGSVGWGEVVGSMQQFKERVKHKTCNRIQTEEVSTVSVYTVYTHVSKPQHISV